MNDCDQIATKTPGSVDSTRPGLHQCLDAGSQPGRRVEVGGLASLYISAVELEKFDRTFFTGGVFTRTKRSGEIASVDFGPMLGVGVGVAGARVRVFPLEFGVGTLFYRPRPPVREEPEIESEEPDEHDEPDEAEDDSKET